jgi:hypothetical protein
MDIPNHIISYLALQTMLEVLVLIRIEPCQVCIHGLDESCFQIRVVAFCIPLLLSLHDEMYFKCLIDEETTLL